MLLRALITSICCITIACKNDNQKEYQDEKSLDAPFVSVIYPELDSIPENVLKFYIQFSRPMREGDFLNHIQLVDSKGNNLKGVFFDNVYELWTPNHKQLTILVDPGRVKTGLRENLNSGRAFVAGEKYTLTVNDTWKSIKGTPLIKAFSKTFTAIAADTVPPKVDQISITSIKPNSKEPIEITFNEALDVLQLYEYVSIISDDAEVSGSLNILNKGKSIQFTPLENWKEQDHNLRIDRRLEDIAANNFSGKFDSPQYESEQYHKTGYINKIIPNQ